MMAVLFNPIFQAENIEYQIEKNYKLDETLRLGANFVNEFEFKNGVLPTDKEYIEWASTQKQLEPYSLRNTFLVKNKGDIIFRLSDTSLQKKSFGTPPDGTYLIGIWRGEWHEFYVSWTQSTTLIFTPRDYFMLGSATMDFLLLLFISIVFGFVSIVLWKR
ncbi:MAG: hypothetical protein ABJ275_02580 [Maricaulaceae bacterium]